MRYVIFRSKMHSEKTIEVPTKGGKIEVDSKGFVHLRNTYNGYRMIQEEVLNDKFESTESVT